MHSRLSALAERPRDADAEIGGQRLRGERDQVRSPN